MTYTTTNEFYGIGIDESNHHTVPEVYVLALSKNPIDLEPTDKFLQREKYKRKGSRNDHIAMVEEFLGKVSIMRFIVLYKKQISRLGRNGVKAPAMHRLISSLEGAIDIEMAQIMIDGEHIQATHCDLRDMLQSEFGAPVDYGQINFMEKADRHIPLVNRADILAYNLMRIYEKIPDHRRGPFANHRVSLGIHLRETDTKQKYAQRPKGLRKDRK